MFNQGFRWEGKLHFLAHGHGYKVDTFSIKILASLHMGFQLSGKRTLQTVTDMKSGTKTTQRLKENVMVTTWTTHRNS